MVNRCNQAARLLLLGLFCAPSLGFCKLPPAARVRGDRVVRRLERTRGGASMSLPAVPTAPLFTPFKAPPDNYANAVAIGTKKANMPIFKILMLGILAGLQVGIGAAIVVSTLGGCPGLKASNPGALKLLSGVLGLPSSLFMVLATGAELFTGNTAILPMALWEGKITKRQLLKNWFWSFTGNLIGGVILAAMVKYCGVFGEAGAAFAAVGDLKASFSFPVAVVRGILCNWLVCSGVWMGIGAADLASKAIACIMSVFVFVALGFEHSVANMFIGPIAALYGSNTSFVQFFLKNLVPVTLGNILGGALLVAGFAHVGFGSFGQKKQ